MIMLTHAALPLAVMRPIGMLSDAALPVMLLVMGMQLERAVMPTHPAAVAVAVALSLVVSPLVGVGLSILLGLSGPARQAAILLASMPAAVVTTVLALEFDLDPNFATSVVFVSTVLSPFSLVLIIAYLQRLSGRRVFIVRHSTARRFVIVLVSLLHGPASLRSHGQDDRQGIHHGASDAHLARIRMAHRRR